MKSKNLILSVNICTILEVHQRVLCVKWMKLNNVRLRTCTLKSMHDVVMWYILHSPFTLHLGFQRYIRKVNQGSYYWPNIREYVTDYLKSCFVCEERKNPQRQKRSVRNRS